MIQLPCCPKCKEKRINVSLTFKRAELLYDASNYSYIEGDVIRIQDEHTAHMIFDIVQDGNVDRVTRVLNLAHSECVEMLYPYTKTAIPETEDKQILNDILTEPDTYTIDLSLPDNFSETTVKLLENLIHEYLVCRVVADWFSIAYPAKEINWEKKFTSLRTKIKSALMSRRGATRRKIQPF